MVVKTESGDNKLQDENRRGKHIQKEKSVSKTKKEKKVVVKIFQYNKTST